jgi:hypothetical protein
MRVREGETGCNILSGASVLLYHSLNVITVVNAAVKGRKASLSVLLIRTVPSKPIFTIKKLFLHLLGWKCSFKPLTLIEQYAAWSETRNGREKLDAEMKGDSHLSRVRVICVLSLKLHLGIIYQTFRVFHHGIYRYQSAQAALTLVC